MDRREMMTAVAATAGTAILPQISTAQDRGNKEKPLDYDAIVVGVKN